MIRAAQQLSTDIVFSTSLGTFGQADAEALGEASSSWTTSC